MILKVPTDPHRKNDKNDPIYSPLRSTHTITKLGMGAAGSEFLRIMLALAVDAERQGSVTKAHLACSAAGVLAAIMEANHFPVMLSGDKEE